MADDLVARSDDLDSRLDASRDAIDSLVQHDRRNRKVLVMLAVSLAVDVMLSIGLGVVVIQAASVAGEARIAAAKATANTNAARAACANTNAARAAQVALWGYILDLPPTGPTSPEQDAQRAQLRAYVDRTFAQRKC